MKLIRVEETGIQHQYDLPSLQPTGNKITIDTPLSDEEIRKQERINKMLLAQGKQPEKTKIDLPNHIEMNHVYATISGYEYIKMDLVEFWNFLMTLNALANIDGDELGFFGVNLFVPREKVGAIRQLELVQFEYIVDNINVYPGNVLGMCDALAAEDLTKKDLENFFLYCKHLG